MEPKDYDDQLDTLISTFIKIGNSMAKKPNPLSDNSLLYSEGLGRKVLHHAISIRHLYKGVRLITNDGAFTPQIDFASICILTRAALETYLAFNYIYIAPSNPKESYCKFLFWDLSGYIERSKYLPKSDDHQKLKDQEEQMILKLTDEIKNEPYFQNLTSKMQRLALNGKWRLDQTWSKLAVKSGFSETFFNQQYSFLCGYAHSGRVSVMQIMVTKELEKQWEMAQASIGVLMVVLAKTTYDYVNLIPGIKSHIDTSSEECNVITRWKTIGENL